MKRGVQFRSLQTWFNGNHFRSRLEARWAVVFVHLGLTYNYEHEGFHFNGISYLPDFLIPAWGDKWVEIKSNRKRDVDQGKNTCREFSLFSGEDILLFSGNPWPGEFNVTHYHKGKAILVGELMEVIRPRFTGLAIVADQQFLALSSQRMGKLHEAFASARAERFGT